jgi:dihydrofolate reductase
MTFEQHVADVDFIVMGRKTFDIVMAFAEWPYPERELLVLSTTTQELPRDAPRCSRVVGSLDEVGRILDEEGAKMVYVDGGHAVREFLRRGWVDEMVLAIAPVLLAGGGRSLFGDVGLDLPADMHFALLGVDVIEDGMVSCYYRVAKG